MPSRRAEDEPALRAPAGCGVRWHALGRGRRKRAPSAVATHLRLNTVFMPLAMQSTAEEVLGRSRAALIVFPAVASLVATGLTGWLASTVLRGLSVQVGPMHFGPVDSVFFAAGLLMTVAGAWATVRLRRHAAMSPEPVPVGADHP